MRADCLFTFFHLLLFDWVDRGNILFRHSGEVLSVMKVLKTLPLALNGLLVRIVQELRLREVA